MKEITDFAHAWTDGPSRGLTTYIGPSTALVGPEGNKRPLIRLAAYGPGMGVKVHRVYLPPDLAIVTRADLDWAIMGDTLLEDINALVEASRDEDGEPQFSYTIESAMTDDGPGLRATITDNIAGLRATVTGKGDWAGALRACVLEWKSGLEMLEAKRAKQGKGPTVLGFVLDGFGIPDEIKQRITEAIREAVAAEDEAAEEAKQADRAARENLEAMLAEEQARNAMNEEEQAMGPYYGGSPFGA